jgi:protein-tyrosine phosphatase
MRVVSVVTMQPVVDSVEVEYVAPGALEVRWSFLDEADAGPVDIAHGPRPDTVDHAHVHTADAAARSFTLTGLGEGPHYVSVGVHGSGTARVGGERLVRLEGLQNFRDLGGYRVAGGGHTRWGRLFRADSLHKLTPADHATLDRLGLRVIADLRSDKERDTHPNPLELAVQYEIVGQARAERMSEATRDLSDVDGEAVLRNIYVGSLEHSAHLFGALLTSFASEGGLPAVFHCHAGKDRTGIVAALVLLAVGVDRDTVLDDYELTRRYRTFENQQDSYANMLDLGMSPEAAAGVLSTPRWAMQEAVDAIDGTYGGIEHYLISRTSLSAGALDALRAALVEH